MIKHRKPAPKLQTHTELKCESKPLNTVYDSIKIKQHAKVK